MRSLRRGIEARIYDDLKRTEQPAAGSTQEIVTLIVRRDFGHSNNGGWQFAVEVGCVVGVVFGLQLALEFGESRLFGERHECMRPEEISEEDDGNNAQLAEGI